MKHIFIGINIVNDDLKLTINVLIDDHFKKSKTVFLKHPQNRENIFF